MGIVVVPTFGADPVTITGPTLDAKVDGLATEFNGNIDNANIKSAAAIAYSKLALTGGIVNADVSASAAIVDTKLATVSTAGKVNFSALVVGSQATGDLAYASSATVWTRLAAGTTSQVLRGNAGAPSWGALPTAALPAGVTRQTVNVRNATMATGTTDLPNDNSIPQITEGDEFMTLAITPTSASNKLLIRVVAHLSHSSANVVMIGALFQDATAGALAAGMTTQGASGGAGSHVLVIEHYMDAGTTSATTFRFRAGAASDTVTFNGVASGAWLGGVLQSTITISEIVV